MKTMKDEIQVTKSIVQLLEYNQKLEARIVELEKELSETIGERNEAIIILKKYQNTLDRFGLSADSEPQFQQGKY